MSNAHPVIRMFTLCESMKWSHLPLAGGLYDQDPDLLDGFLIIFHARNEYESKEADKRDREANRGKSPGGSRSGASRPRRRR